LNRAPLIIIALAALLAAGLLSACGGDDDAAEPAATDLPSVGIDACAEPEYGGGGTPTALIVSDLPMQGDSAERSRQQVEAIRHVLDKSNWSAGQVELAFQACDDSIAETGAWDPEVCEANAEAYAEQEELLGVVGTYNSGCAEIMIPILSEAGVAMVSPGNTAVCLTEASPVCAEEQPDDLYPGERNYARVVPNDAFQGAALAEFAAERGIERPFVLFAADDPTSEGQAFNFSGAAADAGLEVVGYEPYDENEDDYSGLMREVDGANADAVVVAGLIEQNGEELITQKVDELGDNDELPLIAYDGFAQQSTIDGAGAASEGMFASVPGSDPDSLTGEGEQLVEALREELDAPIEQFAPFAGEAAAILLDAIAEAGADRADVVTALFEITGGGGILDPYDISASGDPTEGTITVLVAGEEFSPEAEISPGEDAVRAARAGD
jgi:branched-chain amino acid transport system substrate-binding protein